MSKNTSKADLRTLAIVLRRTKYGETDRILSLLTPAGKIDVVAKGVRREKSKLAGGIEPFCLSEVTVHQKSGDADALGILTSAKMQVFYRHILTDLERLELASQILKYAAKLSSQITTPELFSLVKQVYEQLDAGQDLALIRAWALFNLTKISGADVNLIYDIKGDRLSETETYAWNSIEQALEINPHGHITASHIKLMRLMLATDLRTITHVKGVTELLPEVLHIAQANML